MRPTPPLSRSMSPTDHGEAPGAESAGIDITAEGDRRTLEALYLELRELAKQHGLEIECRLSRSAPQETLDS